MSGRKEVYCCISRSTRQERKNSRGRFPLEPWTEPKIMPYDIKDKTHLVLIDTLAAIYCGVVDPDRIFRSPGRPGRATVLHPQHC